MAMMTIHTTGKAPNTPPITPDIRARPTGILKAKIATASATSSDQAPATCAFVLTSASSAKNVTSGSRATSADQATLPATGSVGGVNVSIVRSLHAGGGLPWSDHYG